MGPDAEPTFSSLTLTDLTANSLLYPTSTGLLTSLGAATDGQIPIGSTGADPVLAEITGTANQVTVTSGAGSITLSLPQDIHTGASPTFAGLTLTAFTGVLQATAGVISGGAAHSVLTSLAVGDDHTQYALLAGRSGGQTLYGSTVTAEDLTLGDNSVDDNTITVTQIIAAYTHSQVAGGDSVHVSVAENAAWDAAYAHSLLVAGNPHSVTPTELGLVIGTDVQAWDAQLDDIAALAYTNGNIIVGDGSNWVVESGNTARTSLGLGTGDSPIFTGVTITGNSVFGLNSSVFQPATDSTTFLQFKDADGNVDFNYDSTNERVGIGTDSPTAALDISYGGLSLVLGAEQNSRSRRNNTWKYGRFMIPHYSNSEQPVVGMYGSSTNTDNTFYFGGGTSQGNAATNIRFYTAVNNTTVTGTERMRVSSDGFVHIGLGGIDAETLIEMTYATPYITLHNSTHEDTDGGRESRLNFKGEQSGGEETTLARIEVSHDGAADDQKGKIVISTNDGNDGDTPTQALEIGSDLLATFAGAITGSNLSGTNTGDQTTIAGITGTKAEFDTACTDGDFMYVGGAPTAHLHDGDTLEHDGVNSSAGAFAFDTAGIVTFSNAITMSAGMDLTIAGHIIFNTNNSYIGFTDPKLTFDDTNNLIQVTGKFTLPDSGYLGCASDTTALQILPAGDIVLTDSLYTNAGLYILERADDVGHIATWGHVWVKNDTPNTLWFTDDAGNNVQLGTGIAAHAMLDGSVHTDTVADDISRGSIIYGNSTPKWDELTIGAADTFLGSDGTDLSYRTAAQVMASLSGEAGAAFSINSQSITDVGSIVVNDDGTIGVTDGTPGITFDDTDGQVEISGDLVSPGGNIHAGVDGTTRGFFRAYGPAGSDYGGSFISYTSAGEDDTIDSYMFTAYQDDCHVCYAAGVGGIITVIGPTCNVSISTILGVTGASVSIGEASTTTGTLVLYDSNSANTVTIQAPDVSAGSLTFTLPATDGDNTNVLQTDGNGVLTWAAAGGGTDEKVKVDGAATAGYLGVANNDGVLRGADPIIFSDGGDYVSLSLSYTSNLCKTGSALDVSVGIADDKILQVDDADAADDDYAKFTANGIEGRSYSEVLGDLSGEATSAFSFNSQNLTSVGTIGCGAVTGTGVATFEGASVTIGKASTTTGTLVLHDSNSANTITLTVPDISAGSLSFTLPPTDGANTNVLQTNGSGVLTWVAAGAGSGAVVQVVNTQTGAVNTGSTIMPVDDTIPQNTEGDEYMTLAITPTSATNKLKIDVTFIGAMSAVKFMGVALFQDSTANALASTLDRPTTSDVLDTITFTHYMTAGTTSSTTFKVRAGPHEAATLTFNGSATARKHGGVLASSITITEIAV